MLTKIESKGDGSSLGFLANWGALLEPLKLHPEECRLRASRLCGNNMGGGGAINGQILHIEIVKRMLKRAWFNAKLFAEPVRPDDDEGVEANDEAKEAGVDNVVVTVDKVSDHLD